ncbi:hypothetical protein HAX54_004167, partial [Datura stramonium]|nr:hypothetical protein [Datura stramonium]
HREDSRQVFFDYSNRARVITAIILSVGPFGMMRICGEANSSFVARVFSIGGSASRLTRVFKGTLLLVLDGSIFPVPTIELVDPANLRAIGKYKIC